MKITVLIGTPVKGITDLMLNTFLQNLPGEHTVTTFTPKQLPPFCLGCKSCFLRGEANCPHAAQMNPLWAAIMEAELLVFAYPVYALRAPASIKSALDHFCVHWMVHRPEPAMFEKTAVIITNSVGAPNGSAQKDVKTSLEWMGVSRIYTCGAGMMGDILIDKLTDAHRAMLQKKMEKLARRVGTVRPVRRMRVKVKLLFAAATLEHKMILKGETVPGLDTAHYIKHGWIAPPKQA